MRHRAGRTIALALGLIWLAIAGLPFYFMVQSGFKKQFDLLTAPFWTLPKSWSLDNYRTVLGGAFLHSLLNSLWVVAISVTLILVAASMAAYAFARLEFRFNRVLFAVVVAGLTIPVHVTLIPVYLLTTRLGLYDTLWALIGPYVAFNLPLSIFVLAEFMRGIYFPLAGGNTGNQVHSNPRITI
jgi:raffinose/stachyose/melibiose transport system permease protein